MDILDRKDLPKDFRNDLLKHFTPKKIDGDGGCYYSAVYAGIHDQLDGIEKAKLLSLRITDGESFREQLKQYFLKKLKDTNDKSKITVTKKPKGRVIQKKISITPRIKRSLLEGPKGPTCPRNWGTDDISDIISGYFFEELQIEVNILLLLKNQQGWKWTRKRGTKILIYPSKKLTVFLFKTAGHFDALLPKRKPDDQITEIPLQYSYIKTEKATQTAANTGTFLDSDEDEKLPGKGKRKRASSGSSGLIDLTGDDTKLPPPPEEPIDLTGENLYKLKF